MGHKNRSIRITVSQRTSVHRPIKFKLVLILLISLISFKIVPVEGYNPNDGGSRRQEEPEPVGILGQVRNFIGEIGHIASDINSGINKLSRQIRTVEEFLDATVDEDCYFECPQGGTAKPRKSHVPTTNGCGSYGIEDYLKADMLPLSEFVDCCNSHDICYETCGFDKDECDLKFKKCLYGKCRLIKDSVTKLKYMGCQAGAKLLYTGTTAVGCKPYLESQTNACDCGINKDRSEF